MTGDVVLHTRNLGKRYGRRWAVRGLDLQVRRGDVFGFLGPNGAGKSTTIRMLLSLVRPTSGGIELFGLSLGRRRAAALRRVGGFVERADFYLYLSGRRNLEIVAGVQGGVRKGAIDEVLGLVGLRDRGNDRVKTYSHGMKQRLGIAQALLADPELIILDEPTSGLDPQGIKEVRELIRILSFERGMTVFLSSHLLGEIEQTATRMAIINRGALVIQGGVRELLDSADNTLRIHADPPDRAMDLLRGLPFAHAVTRAGDAIDAAVPLERAAEVNAALVAGGVQVRALMPRRSLEQYFLSLTEGEGEVTAPERPR